MGGVGLIVRGGGGVGAWARVERVGGGGGGLIVRGGGVGGGEDGESRQWGRRMDSEGWRGRVEGVGGGGGG